MPSAIRPVRAVLPALLLAGLSLFGALGANSVQAQPDVDTVERSIVRVVVGGHGTGWVVSPGIVATNWHVAQGTDTYDIWPAGTDESYTGTLLWLGDEDHDLALIQVQGLPLAPFKLHTADTPRGRPSYTVGFPGLGDDITGYANSNVSVYGGTIALMVENAAGVRIIQHTNIVNAGNSGGPLLDECGRVLGLTTWGRETEGYQADFIWASMHVAELAKQLDALGIPYETDNSDCVTNSGGTTTVIVDDPEAQARLESLLENTAAQEEELDSLAENTRAQQEALEEIRNSSTRQQDEMSALVQKLYLWGGGFAVLLALTLALALRKPRQQIVHALQETSRRIRNFNAAEYERPERAKPVPATAGLVISSMAGATPIRLELDAARLQQEPKGISIGRSATLVDYLVRDESVSRRHCRLSLDGKQFQVEDLNSSNGTFVNGIALTPFQPHPLKAGDALKVGSIVFTVSQR